jgi:F-type H+-transporting ATPase subunit gamma
LLVGNEFGRLPPQFLDASKIANAIFTSGFEFDKGEMFFNQFK